VSEQDLSDEELEEELDKAFKASESKKNVFNLTRNEKESLSQRKKSKKEFDY